MDVWVVSRVLRTVLKMYHFGHAITSGMLSDLGNRPTYIVVREIFSNTIKFSKGSLAGLVIAIGDTDWMDTTVKQGLSLFQQCWGKDNNASCAITDFIILRFREFN